MKAIIVSIGLLLSTLALAAPAAAECVDNETTGTSLCASADPATPNDRSVFANQAGVGSLHYNAYEYSFFGMTMRGESLSFFAAYDGPLAGTGVMYDWFCSVDRDGSCAGESRNVNAWSQDVGSIGLSVSQWGDETEVCYTTYVNDEYTWECAPTL